MKQSMKLEGVRFISADFLPGDTVLVTIPGTTITMGGTVVDGEVADSEIAVCFTGNAGWTPVSVGNVADAWFGS